jgi:carbamoyl-phosphate synthase large subunit
MGGQIPNNLAIRLFNSNAKILGTSPIMIDNAEDRHKFSKMLDRLHIDQPAWRELSTIEEAKEFAEKVGFPVLVRPSYVLSGAAMNVAHSEDELVKFLGDAADVSKEYPIVITKFIEDAKEIEIDAVAKDGEVIAYAVSEHVENAGIHSGDATLVLPAQNLYLETIRRIKKITKSIAQALNITGPFNIQYIAKENKIKVIECNLRSSRSFPFVSKVLKINFIDMATRVMMGRDVAPVNRSAFELDYVGVKAPQFSFTRLRGADPVLGVEMASTGEVACLGEDIHEAFLKSLLSTGFKLPKKNILLSTGRLKEKAQLLESAKQLVDMGYSLFATGGTANFLINNGISATMLHWPLEADKKPNIIDHIKEGKLDLIINIPKSHEKEELSNNYIIRRKAVDYSIPLITNRKCANLFVEALAKLKEDDLHVKSWDEYV